MASPDTEELATIPLPAAAPDLETVPQERAEPESVEAEGSEAERARRGQGTEPGGEPGAERPKDGGRWWRGFTGSLAAGLAVLAAGVLGVAGVCLFTGAPGPGAAMLIGHPIAAVLALIAQRVVDRRNGPRAAAAGLVVVLLTVSALVLFWLT